MCRIVYYVYCVFLISYLLLSTDASSLFSTELLVQHTGTIEHTIPHLRVCTLVCHINDGGQVIKSRRQKMKVPGSLEMG